MQIRRIVTGTSPQGKSVFQSDSAAPRTTEIKSVPGFITSLLWETPAKPVIPPAVGDPAVASRSWVPPPGGTNLMFVTFPPDEVAMSPDFDPVAAGGEILQTMPGLAETFERDQPGMHTTSSVDYAVLLEGELDLELDDGATRTLSKHDVVIQNGGRHAWRNRSGRPATMLFVLVGAERV